MADPLELAFPQRPFKLFLDKRRYLIQTFTTLQLTISFKLEKNYCHKTKLDFGRSLKKINQLSLNFEF